MCQGAELLCTCPQPPAPPTPGPPDSYGIATAAILPPPPSFTGGQASQPQVTTVPVTKVRTEDAGQTSLQLITCFTPQFPGGAAPCFVTLPRNTRRHAQAGAGAGQGEEVRLVPYFDGVGPRTSAAGSLDPQQQGDCLDNLSCPCQDAEYCWYCADLRSNTSNLWPMEICVTSRSWPPAASCRVLHPTAWLIS